MINQLENNAMPGLVRTTDISMSANQFWAAFLESMVITMSTSQYRTWIRPLTPVGFSADSSTFIIAAPNQFKLEWIKTQFSNQINDLATIQSSIVAQHEHAAVNQLLSAIISYCLHAPVSF